MFDDIVLLFFYFRDSGMLMVENVVYVEICGMGFVFMNLVGNMYKGLLGVCIKLVVLYK